MDLTPMVDTISEKARANRPITNEDWRDSEGLLHCGKCGEKIEHIINPKQVVYSGTDEYGRVKKKYKELDFSKFDYEHRKLAEETYKSLKGRKVPCSCKCDEAERQRLTKLQRENKLREMRFFAFGNSMYLSGITLDKDNGNNSRISSLMNRYVKNFSDTIAKGTCIILSGDHNTGKTFFSIAITNALIDKGYYVSYSSIHKVNSKTSPYITVQHVINAETFVDLLIIEDVNEECMDGKNYHTLVNYIGTMQAHNKPIIITTRMTGDKLDQLKEVCKKSFVIEMGKDQ